MTGIGDEIGSRTSAPQDSENLERVLVVDDLRRFSPEPEHTSVEYATTPWEGVRLLREAREQQQPYSELWLDHDMGEYEGRELDVMPVVDELKRYAREYAPLLGALYVHTSSPVGAARIAAALGEHYELRRVSAIDGGLRVVGL